MPTQLAAAMSKEDKMMKRLIASVLAVTLMGTAAASAQSYRHGGHGGGYGRSWHGHRGGGDGAALVGLGIGLFALGAIAASAQRDRYDDRYYDRYEYGPPPPPPPGYAQRFGYYD